MKGLWIMVLSVSVVSQSLSQDQLGELSVEKIMRDPKWMGVPPSDPQWSLDSKTLYFKWNPEQATADSLYAASLTSPQPRKVLGLERTRVPTDTLVYNADKTKVAYVKYGDLFLYDVPGNSLRQVTNTAIKESFPVFSPDNKKLFYTAGDNGYSWNIGSGAITQWTDFRAGQRKSGRENDQEKWLRDDQLDHFEILRQREERSKLQKKNLRTELPWKPKTIFLGDSKVDMITVSPDERHVTYRLTTPVRDRRTIVPNYVTTSGFTEDISARTKVGAVSVTSDFFIYDIPADTVRKVNLSDLPGMKDSLSFISSADRKSVRSAYVAVLEWSPSGKQCIAVVNASDFKDRWIATLDPESSKLQSLHREHNDAWVGGPLGGGFSNTVFGWLSDSKIWFGSEESGFSHLYSLDLATGKKTQLTQGAFEVQKAVLSRDRQFFYLITNEVNPGEKQLYRMSVNGGKRERLTTMTGAHEFFLSPDEKIIAFRYSYTNKPWELYFMENKTKGKTTQVTSSLTREFNSYPWRDPQLVTFQARDKAVVHARLYKPAKPNGAGVVFVHGAGYLQNAHRWWSQYFREYMFHNLLTDQGYTVLDIDYRASAGYGRDWRTSIYRHMGGKDLEDNLDGARYLVGEHGVDPKRIGVYGGSYGGFITLMAMFTAPDVFAAGAALRPVTDWAHYNHRYTGSILNIPSQDSLSYARSSPIYFAEGLKGALLICHGMVDTNVHFQDAVRLAQRLIELGKENWELAVYPMENHGFVEPSSWTDEYKRILKLFNDNLTQRKRSD